MRKLVSPQLIRDELTPTILTTMTRIDILRRLRHHCDRFGARADDANPRITIGGPWRM